MSDGNGNDPPPITETPYDRKTIRVLQVIYVLAIIIWIFLIFKLKLHNTNYLGNLIASLPLIIFIVSLWNLEYLTVETENKLFVINYLSIGLIVFIPLLTWSHENFHISQRLIDIMILAITLAVLSLMDVWVKPKWISVTKHLRSILQVASLSLIIYALYDLYKGSPYPNKKHIKEHLPSTI